MSSLNISLNYSYLSAPTILTNDINKSLSGIMLDKFAEPNRIKLDETIRKLRKMEIRPEE